MRIRVDDNAASGHTRDIGVRVAMGASGREIRRSIVLVGLVVVGAVWIPAGRAARLTPMEALRR